MTTPRSRSSERSVRSSPWGSLPRLPRSTDSVPRARSCCGVRVDAPASRGGPERAGSCLNRGAANRGGMDRHEPRINLGHAVPRARGRQRAVRTGRSPEVGGAGCRTPSSIFLGGAEPSMTPTAGELHLVAQACERPARCRRESRPTKAQEIGDGTESTARCRCRRRKRSPGSTRPSTAKSMRGAARRCGSGARPRFSRSPASGGGDRGLRRHDAGPKPAVHGRPTHVHRARVGRQLLTGRDDALYGRSDGPSEEGPRRCMEGHL